MRSRALVGPRHRIPVAPRVLGTQVRSGSGGGAGGAGGYKSARVALRKRYGQHLLKNPHLSEQIVGHANIDPKEIAFEIGPGTGNLTMHLLEAAAEVHAVELDPRLYDLVVSRVAAAGLGHKFFCQRGNFLSAKLPRFDVMVANIPYQISSPILRVLLESGLPYDRAVIMFQAEFGYRMMAKPGQKNYCRLSVNSQLLAEVSEVMFIDRNQFRPPPKVDSIVVKIRPKGVPEGLDMREWNSMLRLCFMGKNKTMRALFSIKSLLAALDRQRADTNSLVPIKDVVHGALEEAGLSQARANAMGLDQFVGLYNAIHHAGLVFDPASKHGSFPEPISLSPN